MTEHSASQEEIKQLREDIDHERDRRKDLEKDVKRMETENKEAEHVIGAIAHTTNRLLDAVNRDEQLWQNAIVVIKKNP